MKRYAKMMALIATGATVLQFGGCIADILGDVFFVLGPLFL